MKSITAFCLALVHFFINPRIESQPFFQIYLILIIIAYLFCIFLFFESLPFRFYFKIFFYQAFSILFLFSQRSSFLFLTLFFTGSGMMILEIIFSPLRTICLHDTSPSLDQIFFRVRICQVLAVRIPTHISTVDWVAILGVVLSAWEFWPCTVEIKDEKMICQPVSVFRIFIHLHN